MDVQPPFEDPCPRRTRDNRPCVRVRDHVGACSADTELTEAYRFYAKHLRDKTKDMKREEIRAAMEFHLIAWRIYRHEYNAR